MSNINTPSGYKTSPLGIIPEDWEVKRLRDVCTFHNGRAYSQKELLSSGKYRVLRVGNFFTNGSWYWSDMELEDDKYANNGDLLYAWSASFGPKFWEGEKVIYHYHIWKIDSFNDVSKDFLYSFFLYDATKLTNTLQGGTMTHITKENMEKRNIAVPPIHEQQRIVSLLSLWDTAIAKQTALIEKLTLRKRGLMQQLLTGKNSLKEFEGEWKRIKLGDIAERITRKNEEDNQNVVTISAQRGFVVQTDFFNKSVASEILDNYFLVHRDEFCYNKSYSNGFPMGAIKRLKTFDKAVVTTLYICFALKGETTINIDFFEQYCESGILNKELVKVANEGGRAHGLLNVTPSDFFNMHMSVPSVNEQNAIASVLVNADKEIEIQKQKLSSLQEQKKGLMQVLLTGKKRIKFNKHE